MTRFRAALALVGALTITISLVGAVSGAGSTSFRFVNTVESGFSLNVWIDGVKVLSNVAIHTVTEPTEISAGFHDVEITSVGHPNWDLPSGPLHFPTGASTLVAFSSGEHPFLFPDETETLAGSALLRVWYFWQYLEDTAVVDKGTALIPETDLFYPTDYFELSPGGHTLKMVNVQKDKTVFSFPVSVEAATNYTAFIWDVNGELQVSLVVDAATVPDTAVTTPVSTPSPLPVGALLGGLLAVAVLTHRLMGRTPED